MTAEQFLMLGEDPPGIRLEPVDGNVAISPAPTPVHSFAKTSLACIVGTHLEENPSGEMFLGVGTRLDQFNLRRPDLSFCSENNSDRVGEELIEGPPDLAIEVLSPSSVTTDRKTKFTQCCKAGVRFDWIVDPQLKTLEGWELKNRRFVPIGRGQGTGTISLAPFADLEIPLAK